MRLWGNLEGALGHQQRKPLILHGNKGFLLSGTLLTAWIGAPGKMLHERLGLDR
jgi:hypothetical protein